MNAIQKKRLKKWIEFVEKVPTGKFQFSTWGFDRVTREKMQPDLHRCTTVGCAAGWLPTIFPRRWRWETNGGYPCLGKEWPEEGVGRFFGLSEDVAVALVSPRTTTYTTSEKEVRGIGSDVTPKRWAQNARRILKAHNIQFE